MLLRKKPPCLAVPASLYVVVKPNHAVLSRQRGRIESLSFTFHRYAAFSELNKSVACLIRSCGSAVSASRLVIAIPDILADDADLRFSEFLVELALVWDEVHTHSKKTICGLGRVRANGVS